MRLLFDVQVNSYKEYLVIYNAMKQWKSRAHEKKNGNEEGKKIKAIII